MPEIQALSDEELTEFKEALLNFEAMRGDEDQGEGGPAWNHHVGDGDVEINTFPLSKSEPGKPIDTLRVEVRVDPEAEWYEELTAYSSGNLRNGGPIYQALAGEIEEAVEDVTDIEPALTADTGGRWFCAEVAL